MQLTCEVWEANDSAFFVGGVKGPTPGSNCQGQVLSLVPGKEPAGKSPLDLLRAL